MTDPAALIEETKRNDGSRTGLKKQLDEYREQRRSYDEMQKGRPNKDNVKREQRTERKQRTERQYKV